MNCEPRNENKNHQFENNVDRNSKKYAESAYISVPTPKQFSH